MSHRVLFFLSIIVIAVGVAGIFIQRDKHSEPQVETLKKSGSRVVTIAEARRELHPYEILQAEDYKIRTLEVDNAKDDVRDLSPLSSLNLNGYLVHNNIAEGGAIIPGLIEAPTSHTFIMHSLRGNELPYSYAVKPGEEYLLSALKVGNKVSLFIRVTEIERGKKSDVSFVREGSGSSDKELKKYSLSPVLVGLSILDIHRDKKNEGKSYSGDPDAPIGRIVLRMNQEQLADIRVVEKAGEIILFPAEGSPEKNKKKKMDEVLPQFRAIKELRGGK